MNQVVQIKQNSSVVPNLSNSQITNELSLLASTAVVEKQDGKHGYTEHGYDFIPYGPPRKIAARGLTEDELDRLSPLFSPPSLEVIKALIGMLAQRKRISGVTEHSAASLFHEMAVDLSRFSEMAIRLAFQEIRCGEGEWFPLGSIVHHCRVWQEFVDDLYRRSHGEAEMIAIPSPQQSKGKAHAGQPVEEEWTPPTEEEKAAVSALVEDCIKSLGVDPLDNENKQKQSNRVA